MPMPVGDTVSVGPDAVSFDAITMPATPAPAPPTMLATVVCDKPPPLEAAVPDATDDASAAVATVVCAMEIAAVCPWNAADAAICRVPLLVAARPVAVARPVAFVVTVSVRAPLNVARPFE